MATKRQRANGTWEFCFQRKGVLPQRVYFTFDTEAEGEACAERAEEQLARGVVPPEMGEVKWETLQDLFDAYEASGAAGKSDLEMFAAVGKAVGKRRLIDTNYNWVEDWTETLSETLAPSSIKKRVEFLGRAIAWGMRREKLSYLNNPVKQLPKGYATKNVAKEKLWAGERDRRLEEREVRVGEEVYQTEEGAIRSVVTEKMETLFLDMALETAMRMREMFTLRLGQIDLKRRTIFLDKTKNGHKRQVPISSVLLKKLETALPDDGAEDQLLFPWWDGEEAVERVWVNNERAVDGIDSARLAKAFNQPFVHGAKCVVAATTGPHLQNRCELGHVRVAQDGRPTKCLTAKHTRPQHHTRRTG